MLAVQREHLGGGLALVQALARRAGPTRLWLVTAGSRTVGAEATTPRALAQAPLWGLGGVVAREQPAWECRRVDLDPTAAVAEQAQTLVDELSAGDDEDQIAYRQARRQAARLVRLAERPTARLAVPATPFRLQLEAYGQLDRWQAAPLTRRPPGAGEVEIAVRAVGLNFRDVLRALGMLADYEREHLGIATAQDAPFGFECAGEVVAVGAGVDGIPCRRRRAGVGQRRA